LSILLVHLRRLSLVDFTLSAFLIDTLILIAKPLINFGAACMIFSPALTRRTAGGDGEYD
jgi:hypothetical protein